jgi:hypothetical protein
MYFSFPPCTYLFEKVKYLWMFIYSLKKEDVENYNIDESYLDIQLGGKKKSVNKEARKFTNIDEILKKTVITPGFEKLESVPAYQESDRIMQKKRKVCVTKKNCHLL